LPLFEFLNPYNIDFVLNSAIIVLSYKKGEVKMKTILFQGDSITDCGRVRSNDKNIIEKCRNKVLKKTPLGTGYPALVSAELSSAYPGEYEFYNRGVSGDRVPDIYARIVRDIIKIRPDYMSILVGVNDVWHGFDFNNGTGIERYKKVYNLLIEEIKQELPDIKIMILEPFVLEGSATENRKDQPQRYKNFRGGVLQMAEIAKGVAEKHNLKFVPLQTVLDEAATKYTPTELLSDGVHPTAKGHGLIKKEWLKAFDDIK